MKMRLAKFISESGFASRRAAEKLIESGAVSVDGIVINTPVFFVNGSEKITINGKPISIKNETKLYIFNKPINTMTTNFDPDGRRTIFDVLPAEYKNLKYVGRLDFKTTGLLLMTNDGALARRLTLPDSNILRTYIANVFGGDFKLLELARAGIKINGINYRPMDINILDADNLKITISEGKKNEIRIVLAYLGFVVKKLHRISFGDFVLGNIFPGEIVKVPQKMIDAQRICV